jgi:hypothetical protein
MPATILLVARFIVIGTEGPLLAEGHNCNLFLAYTRLNKITTGGLCPFVA